LVLDCDSLARSWQRLTRRRNWPLKKLGEINGLVLYEDECHFHQQSGKCKAWTAPEEKDPVYLLEPGRASVNVLGAVNPKDGTLYTMITDMFNAETVWEFLTMLMDKLPGQIHVVLDNSKPHRAKRLAEWASTCADRIQLLFLPPYTPHLNKIERVWKLARKTTTHNKYFETKELLKQVLEWQFKLWKKPNNTLKTLCAN
jgi:transposase